MDNYYVHNYGQLERHQFKPIQSVDDSTLNQPAIYRECAETCTWAFPLLSVVQMCAISCFHCLLLLSYNTVPMVFIVVNLFPHEASHQKLYFFIQKIISCSQFNCSTYLLFETDGCYFANETCALRSDFNSSNQWMNMCSFPFFNENQHVRELSDIQQSACVCQQQTNNLNVFSLEFNMTKLNIS